MPRSTRAVRRIDLEGPTRATALAPVDHAPAFGLSLPRIGPEVPLTCQRDAGKDNLVALATGMAVTGILKPFHFRHGLRKAVDDALQMLITRHEADWQLFSNQMAFGFTDDLTADYRSCYMPTRTGRRGQRSHYQRKERCSDEGRPVGAFHFVTNRQRESYVVGRTLERLEAENKGAGGKLLRLIEQGLGCCFGATTPMTVYGIAQYHYWAGEMDEKELCRQFREPDERVSAAEAKRNQKWTDAQICEEYQIRTKAWLFSQYPEWAIDVPGRVWGDKAEMPTFRTLKGDTRGTAAAANALSRHLRALWPEHQTGQFTLNDRGHVEYTNELAEPVILRWSEKDPTLDIYDDAYNETINCGGDDDLDTCAYILFEIDDPKDIARACERLKLMLQTATLTDRLLATLISDEPLRRALNRTRIRTATTTLDNA